LSWGDTVTTVLLIQHVSFFSTLSESFLWGSCPEQYAELPSAPSPYFVETAPGKPLPSTPSPPLPHHVHPFKQHPKYFLFSVSEFVTAYSFNSPQNPPLPHPMKTDFPPPAPPFKAEPFTSVFFFFFLFFLFTFLPITKPIRFSPFSV